MFPDAEHVRDMQKELDAIIQLGVFNITRLLKASETNISSGTAKGGDDIDFKYQKPSRKASVADVLNDDGLEDLDTLPPQKRKLSDQFKKAQSSMNRLSNSAFDSRLSKSRPGVGQGKLTAHLLKQGLLTPKMLEDLQKEWLRNVKKDDPQNGKDDDDY